MENLRKRVDVTLVRASEIDKLRRLLNRPICVDISILDLSKTLMYDFYYNRIKAEYGERCQLLILDTDGLLLEIETEDMATN